MTNESKSDGPVGDRLSEDDGSIRRLSLVHFVFASAVFACCVIPAAQVFLSSFVLHMVSHGESEHAVEGAKRMSLMMAVFGCLMSLPVFASALCIRRRSGYVFVAVTSALACLLIPIGTVFGVWSISVLMKPEVRSRFH